MRRLVILVKNWDVDGIEWLLVVNCKVASSANSNISKINQKVSFLFSHLDFTNISVEDKIWATYLHACIKYIEGNVSQIVL